MITKGTLKVIDHYQQAKGNGGGTYTIQCACGNVFEKYKSRWERLTGKGCPKCFRKFIKSNYRHGGNTINKPEYNSWRAMVARCTNKNYWAYHRYGGRGIKICDRWINSFPNFLEDMGKKPTPKHSLDRINNKGNYEPDNCRWANQYEQSSNIEKNVKVTINNTTHHVAEWAKLYNINLQTVYSRVKQQGWSWDKAITTPTKGRGSNQTTYS